MEHRLEHELNREPDDPPPWWDGRKHTAEYYDTRSWIDDQEAWLRDWEAWFYGDEREYCPCNAELTLTDREQGREHCEDCR